MGKMYGSHYGEATRRVPSKEDWEELLSFLISHEYNWDKKSSENNVGKALASQSEWDTLSKTGVVGNDLLNNNPTGFCAYPSGRRLYRGTRTYTVPQEDNGFEHAGKECNWWASSGYVYSAPFYSLWYSDDKLIFGSTNGLSAGFSIRLIKTETK